MRCEVCKFVLETVSVNLSVRIFVRLPNLGSQGNAFDNPTGRAKMFALETAAGESNSLFLMCGRASTTGYDDVMDALLILLLGQASANGERTNSVEVLV